jgi:hypothetical protein
MINKSLYYNALGLTKQLETKKLDKRSPAHKGGRNGLNLVRVRVLHAKIQGRKRDPGDEIMPAMRRAPENRQTLDKDRRLAGRSARPSRRVQMILFNRNLCH